MRQSDADRAAIAAWNAANKRRGVWIMWADLTLDFRVARRKYALRSVRGDFIARYASLEAAMRMGAEFPERY